MDKSEGMSGARVTIVVSPRERFGVAKKSLESIYAASDIPFELVYIDARSPAGLSQWLKAESAKRGFRVIRRDRFVTPNEARNLGAAAADTDFIVFIDNDVICADKWLSALVACADETRADIIAPLVCEGMPMHSRVHQATGAFSHDKAAFYATPPGQRELQDVMTHHKAQLENVREELKRGPTDTCEFHCLMVRRSFFEAIGPLDEKLQATKEHIDFCMLAGQAGGKLVFEPASIVTYLFPSRAYPLTPEDKPYFLLRWSPKWQRQDLDYLQKKWGLTGGGEIAVVSDPAYMRMRHYEGLIKPLIRKIPVVRDSWRLTRLAHRLIAGYYEGIVERLDAEFRRQRAAETSR